MPRVSFVRILLLLVGAAAAYTLFFRLWPRARTNRNDGSADRSPTATDVAGRDISRRREELRAATLAGDAGAAAACYAGDSIAITRSGVALVGPAAIEAQMARAFAVGHFSRAEVVVEDRSTNANVAVETGTYAYRFEATGRPELDVAGRFTAVWNRHGKEWKIALESVRGPDDL